MNKILVIFVIIQIIFLPISSVYAEQQESPIITPLKKGMKVPYDGSLLNNMALAKIRAEKKQIIEKCNLDNKYLNLRGKMDCDLNVNSIKIELDATKKKYDAVVSIKDQEIEELQRLVLDSRESNSAHKWWLAGGIVVGIVVTVASLALATYAIQEVR